MSDVPFGDNSNDGFMIGRGLRDGKGSAQVIEETSIPAMPRGRNEFVVTKIEPSRDAENDNAVTPKPYTVYTPDENGDYTIESQYESVEIQVTYALCSDHRCTVRENFRLPPDPNEPEQCEAYRDSSTKMGGKSSNNFFYNSLRRMLHALGHEDDVDESGEPTGEIPESAQTLGGIRLWPDGSPRTVSLEIIDQTKMDENGKRVPSLAADGKPYAGIKLFSHERTEDTLVRLGHVQPAPPKRPTSPARPAAPAKSTTVQKPLQPAAPAPARPTAPAAPPRPQAPGRPTPPPPPSAGKPKPPGPPPVAKKF